MIRFMGGLVHAVRMAWYEDPLLQRLTTDVIGAALRPRWAWGGQLVELGGLMSYGGSLTIPKPDGHYAGKIPARRRMGPKARTTH